LVFNLLPRYLGMPMSVLAPHRLALYYLALYRLFCACLFTLGLASLAAPSAAQQSTPAQLTGEWLINTKLSDNTDKKVEAALKAAGEKIRRTWFSRNKEYYRGGPAEQELYDRLSYDPNLTIRSHDAYYEFEYNDGFIRKVYTDNRSRTVNLTELESVEDFSLGHWDGERFLVEAHPRDGGFTNETYNLLADGKLEVVCYILPESFSQEIELRRVYDRVK
jgi:hypothetical protein